MEVGDSMSEKSSHIRLDRLIEQEKGMLCLRVRQLCKHPNITTILKLRSDGHLASVSDFSFRLTALLFTGVLLRCREQRWWVDWKVLMREG